MSDQLLHSIFPPNRPHPCAECGREEAGVFVAIDCQCADDHPVGEYFCLSCLIKLIEEERQAAFIRVWAPEIRTAVRTYRDGRKVKDGDRKRRGRYYSPVGPNPN